MLIFTSRAETPRECRLCEMQCRVEAQRMRSLGRDDSQWLRIAEQYKKRRLRLAMSTPAIADMSATCNHR